MIVCERYCSQLYHFLLFRHLQSVFCRRVHHVGGKPTAFFAWSTSLPPQKRALSPLPSITINCHQCTQYIQYSAVITPLHIPSHLFRLFQNNPDTSWTYTNQPMSYMCCSSVVIVLGRETITTASPDTPVSHFVPFRTFFSMLLPYLSSSS